MTSTVANRGIIVREMSDRRRAARENRNSCYHTQSCMVAERRSPLVPRPGSAMAFTRRGAIQPSLEEELMDAANRDLTDAGAQVGLGEVGSELA